jgi:hypothetical protein
LSDNIATIPQGAFAGCTSLTSLEIPYGVITIGNSAFVRCSGLNKIVLSNSVSTIETNAFYDCTYLKTIVLGSSVSYIGKSAFSGKVNDVYCYAERVPETGSTPISCNTLHVPASSIDAYKSVYPWSFMDVVALTDGDPKPTGISTITIDDNDPSYYYYLDGTRIDRPRRGINILHKKNGGNKKIIYTKDSY